MLRLSYFISLAIVVMSLLVTLIPTEQVWCIGDIAFACIVPLTLLAASFVAVTSEKCIRVETTDIVLVLWCLFTIGYAYVYPNFPAASVVVRSILLLMLFFALRVCIARHKSLSDILAILIVVISLVETLLGIYQAVTGCSRNSHFQMTGTFQNPGPYGTLISCGLITLLSFRKKFATVIKTHRYSSLINVALFLVITIMLLVLMMTMSRAAILALVVCISFLYRDKIRKHLLPFCIFFIISSLAFYLIKQNSADSRLIIWQVSLQNIAMYPIIGTGPGSFLHQYADGMAILSSAMPDGYLNATDVVQYAFSFLLLIGVEQGLIGLTFAITLIFVIFIRLRSSNDVLKWTLSLLFVTSFFSYTFELLPFQILIVMVCASIFSEGNTCNASYRAFSVLALFLCLAVSICVIPFVNNRVRANKRYQKISGTMTTEYIQDYSALYPYMNDNPVFLYDFACILSNGLRFRDSNAVLREGILVSADPMFFVLQANNYRNMGELNMAEEYYNRAFAVMPNRLYPLYRMMRLYAEQPERLSDALSTAKRIIAFPVKIASPVTEQMKDEARCMIADYSSEKQ